MSYLDQYGVAEVKRERVLSRTILSLIALVAVSGFLYFWFKNYTEEKRVREFLAALEQGDYAQAYTYWGCSVQAPCPNYAFPSFLEDWGQSSPVGKLQSY